MLSFPCRFYYSSFLYLTTFLIVRSQDSGFPTLQPISPFPFLSSFPLLPAPAYPRLLVYLALKMLQFCPCKVAFPKEKLSTLTARYIAIYRSGIYISGPNALHGWEGSVSMWGDVYYRKEKMGAAPLAPYCIPRACKIKPYVPLGALNEEKLPLRPYFCHFKLITKREHSM